MPSLSVVLTSGSFSFPPPLSLFGEGPPRHAHHLAHPARRRWRHANQPHTPCEHRAKGVSERGRVMRSLRGPTNSWEICTSRPSPSWKSQTNPHSNRGGVRRVACCGFENIVESSHTFDIHHSGYNLCGKAKGSCGRITTNSLQCTSS